MLQSEIFAIPWAPYRRDDSHGVSRDLYWLGTRVATSGSPPTSMCVGAVFEALLRCLKARGYEKLFTVEQILKFRSDLFIDNVDTQLSGVAGALMGLGIGEPVARPEDAQAGDVAQLWDYKNGERVFGHSMIIMGHTVNPDTSAPALAVWSSDPTNGGHSNDWWSYKHPNPSKTRTWHIARPTVEL